MISFFGIYPVNGILFLFDLKTGISLKYFSHIFFTLLKGIFPIEEKINLLLSTFSLMNFSKWDFLNDFTLLGVPRILYPRGWLLKINCSKSSSMASSGAS